MAKRETASPVTPMFPMLKTVEQMSKISGIGVRYCSFMCQIMIII